MFKDLLLNLTKRFYPKGRAFSIPNNSLLEKTHQGLIESENQVLTDAISVIDSIIPDNDNFTIEDATDWERRLGLITNQSVSLADRKLAINRKMNHPGTIKARQHYLFLERELRNAGFDVYVHENRFFELGSWITKTPSEVSSVPIPMAAVHRTGFRHGEFQHGAVLSQKIANSLDSNVDNVFDIGDNLRSTFFIGGQTIGDYADIEEARELEFRQLVLKVKPTQTVGFIFVNYI